MLFFKSKKILGLDIGTSSIKMAELDIRRGGEVYLENIGIAPTPQGSVVGGEVVEPHALSRALKAAVSQFKMKRKHAAAGMWGTAVIVKRVTIPRIEASLVREQIKWEAEQYIPFDINEISLSHHILKNRDVSSDTMDVLIVAAQNELVMQHVSVVQAAGLECSVMDVSGFALANTFEANRGAVPGYTALLNLGAGVTNFVVLKDGDVVFCRDIPVGGQAYTTEIHKELGVTVPEAESLKLSAVRAGEVPAEVHSVISSTNDSVAEEVRNSIEFFLATSPGARIDQCFATGGSFGVPGLKESLSNVIKIPVQELNPYERIRINTKTIGLTRAEQARPFAAVAIGLGLRKLGDA